MNEIVSTSVGDFEIGWGIDQHGATWIEIDPDAGFADAPSVQEVATSRDVTAALARVGIPADEAESMAPALWDRRWRGPAA